MINLLSIEIVDDEGISNFAALILKNDNPKIVDVVTEFTQTAKILREKP